MTHASPAIDFAAAVEIYMILQLRHRQLSIVITPPRYLPIGHTPSSSELPHRLVSRIRRSGPVAPITETWDHVFPGYRSLDILGGTRVPRAEIR